jgi:hypothetical protein
VSTVAQVAGSGVELGSGADGVDSEEAGGTADAGGAASVVSTAAQPLDRAMRRRAPVAAGARRRVMVAA